MRNYILAFSIILLTGLFLALPPLGNKTTAQTGTTANPSFFPLAPCPTCTNPSIAVTAAPSQTSQIPQTGGGNGQVPCTTNNTYLTGDNTNNGSRHKRHDGALSGISNRILQLLIEFLNKLLELLGGGKIEIPSGGAQPSIPAQVPTVPPVGGGGVTIPPQQQPQPCPTSAGGPGSGSGPSTAVPSIGVNPSGGVSPSGAAGGGRNASVRITFYGSNDNDPPGSKAISNPVIHQEAGGTGTFEDPLTFASPEGEGEYAVGQKIYVPLVQKYFIREDICAVSHSAPNGCGATSLVDLYVGNPSDADAVIECENSLTPDGESPIIIDPPAGLTVDPKPIWDQATGTCMTPHQ